VFEVLAEDAANMTNSESISPVCVKLMVEIWRTHLMLK
jgi:hypothetical protein